jgi:hypothetical protein
VYFYLPTESQISTRGASSTGEHDGEDKANLSLLLLFVKVVGVANP